MMKLLNQMNVFQSRFDKADEYVINWKAEMSIYPE